MRRNAPGATLSLPTHWRVVQILVILGLVLVAASMVGLTYCIREGYRIKRSKLPADVVRARLGRLVAVNLASVATAGLGLAMLVIGLAL